MYKKYFYHATETRQNDPEYQDSEPTGSGMETPATSPSAADVMSPKDEELDAFNSALPTEPSTVPDFAPESDTDPESGSGSENEYLSELGEAGSDQEGAKASKSSGSHVPIGNALQNDPSGMETEDALQYDQNLIFKHLYFYLDTISAAEENGLQIAKKNDNVTLDDIAAKLRDNGAEIVSLDDPRLSHIIFDPDDTSRRLQIRKRVCRGVERYMIVVGWVEACLEELTLVDERMYDA